MKCLLCGCETTGSIGAAGIRWPNLCQDHKDQEDAALERQLAGSRPLFKEKRHAETAENSERLPCAERQD